MRYMKRRLMTDKKIKLYKKLKNSPTNASYSDLCKLAELAGFVHKKKTGGKKKGGGHKIYKHPINKAMMNFQPNKKDKSKAKKYQVDQLIESIEVNNLIKENK